VSTIESGIASSDLTGEHRDFFALGGTILEQDEFGKSKRWLCGQDLHDPKGTKLDPPDVADQAVTHFLNNQGLWEGHVATSDDERDRLTWAM